MLIIKIKPGERIDGVLKRYRNKVRKTKQLKVLRSNEHYTKPSKLRRREIAKAAYKEQYEREKEQ
ncbi:30S ribosomal protein S21 [Subsaxibacter sp. CAU 1640]|uniref:30S ribosomal protein S21 n=1 Tax=Subsaxibacter sp. CAU 1640 TaxID=2933271 RepID=UPI0020037A62|nr:30S ribosomal protein S21 [Subsaxibacter sp. CAU 1640]MCK7590597.1 30S ribosomal protein S21 [Subsaxibacter sp. CAU 1640]